MEKAQSKQLDMLNMTFGVISSSIDAVEYGSPGCDMGLLLTACYSTYK